ncbi:hypothetical protein B0A50_00174 [Salinomyces thailandicus]|uniref:Uncharacterized protein n=1 Tax=Salinomyces thailandicus TaxID=706561 RepID=A0A4U0UFH1_9PEZI|nr:hypothetical protein B0A50_00174 [Salinomyces thailandica]
MPVLSTCVFCVADLDTTLSASTGSPVVSVFKQSTGSTAGAIGLTSILLVLLLIISISSMALTTRQTFAFARDNSMVLSSWIAQINVRFGVRLNAVLFTMAFSLLMSLINPSSTMAFKCFPVCFTRRADDDVHAFDRLRADEAAERASVTASTLENRARECWC